MALRYLKDEAEAVKYQPEPLASIAEAKLTAACAIAETEVDKYLGTKGVATPITLASLAAEQQLELKNCTAKMAAAVLFSQHNIRGTADKWIADAQAMLDAFIAHADLEQAATQSGLGVVNAQEEYITDWNDPNATLNAMDE